LLDLLTNIASTEDQRNLSSAIRLFVLNFYRKQLELQHIQKVVQAVLRSPVQALH
jgi:predicted DNA-binding ribbon-helix-helix protein